MSEIASLAGIFGKKPRPRSLDLSVRSKQRPKSQAITTAERGRAAAAEAGISLTPMTVAAGATPASKKKKVRGGGSPKSPTFTSVDGTPVAGSPRAGSLSPSASGSSAVLFSSRAQSPRRARAPPHNSSKGDLIQRLRFHD